MSNSKLLKSITIKEPCSANWDEMKGNDRARFCEHCSIEVKDLSRFSRSEAVLLALRSKGRLCLRIHRTPSDEIITLEVAQKMHTISRRASRLAAGAFTAVMSVSAAGYAPAFGSTSTNNDRPIAHAPLGINVAQGTTWLGGNVTDSNGAVIPGAKVTLKNQKSNETHEAVANDEGSFGFWVETFGPWEVKAEAKYFKTSVITDVMLDPAVPAPLNVILEPGSVTFGVVAITVEYELPLVKSAHNNDLSTVTALLRSGTPANQSEEDGTTALFLAVSQGNIEMVQRLLAAGADARATNKAGGSLLNWLDRDHGRELLALLVKAGANINQVNDEGNTPLIISAVADDGEFIQGLIGAGALVNAQNKQGTSPLMMAAEYGNEDAVRVLLKAGATVGLRNAEGKDALQLAVEAENDEICEILRAAGAADPPK